MTPAHIAPADQARVPVHVEHAFNWMGWLYHCPQCDYDFEKDYIDGRVEYQFVENDTGKEEGEFMPGLKCVALLELECPRCFEWCWGHAQDYMVEDAPRRKVES